VKGAELLVLGFEGTRLTGGERRLLARLRPLGVILVQRNIGADLGELIELVGEVRAATPDSLLALDAEGGRVDRLRDLFGPAPSAQALAARPPALTRRAARWIGAAMRATGFDLDFAPVVDLDRGRSGNALDGRCFGADVRSVVARGRAVLDGLAASGIGGCLKHFPGLGGAPADTHLRPACIERTVAELARDLEPFGRLAARAGAVMAGHAIYPALDPQLRPATLSPPIATHVLRRGLRPRFTGVLFSDDLEMGALGPWGDLPERGAAALAAGCDALLFCRQIEDAPAIAARLARPALSTRRREATARLERLRRQLARLRAAAGPLPDPAQLRARLAAVGAAAS